MLPAISIVNSLVRPGDMDASRPNELRRVGWFTATCLLISNIIGGGVFTTSGFLARDLGDPMVIIGLWVLGAFIAVAGAMVYAELGAALPRAGGDYVYVRAAYGPALGFLSGWTSFTIGFGATIAASSVSCTSYFLRVVPLTEEGSWSAKALTLTLLWGLTAFHAMGVSAGGRLQRIITSTKVVAIVTFLLGAFLFGTGNWQHFSPQAPLLETSLGSAAIGLIFVMYCYLGWNVVGYIAGEIDQPGRTLPRIMIAGTAFVALLYVLLNIAYVYALPITALASPPILPVAEKSASALWGPTAAHYLAAILALSIAGAVSAMVWAGPRVYWAMARDGACAPWLAELHPRTQVPLRAMLLQSAWASLLVLTGSFEQLVVYSGVVLAVFTALSVSAVIILRRRAPLLERPYRVPLYPWLPGMLIVGAAGLILYSLVNRPSETAWGLVTVLTGLPLYWWWQRASGTPA